MTVAHGRQLEELAERVKRESGLTDPDQIAIAVRVTLRSAELGARAAMGEDVQKEQDILHATTLNLTDHVKNVIGRNVQSFLVTIITGVLTKVLVVA